MLKTIPRWEALNTGLLGASGAKQDKAEMQTSTTATENCHKSLESQWASVSPIRIKINLQDFDESDLVLDVPPIMPTSKKSKPFRSFKHQSMDERVHITSPEERKLQITRGKQVKSN